MVKIPSYVNPFYTKLINETIVIAEDKRLNIDDIV